MTLPAAPLYAVGADGQPRLGRYAGLAESFGWHALAEPFRRSALWRRLHHKRWHFVGIVTDEVYCATAVVHVGWGSSAFGYVFERATGRDIACFSSVGLPGMGARVGANARAPGSYRSFSERIDILPAGTDDWMLGLSARGLRIDAAYGGAAGHLLAIGQAEGGSVHATQKSGAMTVAGVAVVGSRRFVLDEGVAIMDYSNGMLGRSTGWRWLSAHGPDVGINLQQGYFGGAENALWLEGELLPLGEVRFDMTPDGLCVRTADGLVELHFTPDGERRDDKQLLVASSRLRQQIGVFDGWVRATPDAAPRAVRRLAGMVEQHHARW